jgi:hypothetical protein
MSDIHHPSLVELECTISLLAVFALGLYHTFALLACLGKSQQYVCTFHAI